MLNPESGMLGNTGEFVIEIRIKGFLLSNVQRSVNSGIFFLFSVIVVCEAPELHRAVSSVDKSIAYLWVHGC